MASPKTIRATKQVAAYCACFNLRKATRAVTQLYDKALAPSTLRVAQFTLLVALSRTEQLTLSQVAEHLVMDRTTLARNLTPLERDGLVTIRRGPDRRERYMHLTLRGHQALEQALPLWRQAQAQVERSVGHCAWSALHEGLQELTRTLRDVPSGPERRPERRPMS